MILVHETSFNILIHFLSEKKNRNQAKYDTIQELQDTIPPLFLHRI